MATFTIRFRSLLTMTNPEPVENGQLIVEGGRIRDIFYDTSKPIEGELIDLSDCLILPGFVNAHCHLSLSILKRRVTRRKSFTNWVKSMTEENKMVSFESRMMAMHAQAKVMARSGVTALVDFLPQGEFATEYASLPFRQTLLIEVLGFLSSSSGSIVKYLESTLKHKLNDNGLISYGLAPHAPYSVSPKLFQEVKRLSGEYNCPISCHLAEFPEELQFLQDGSGEMKDFLSEIGMYDDCWIPPAKSPAQYLDSLGVLESLVAVHLNLVGNDLDLLKLRKVKSVFCPQSTRWFGREKYMPVRNLLDLGMVVGLGTDSLASNESLNFLDELRAAEAMLADVSQEEILFMATRGGAETVGMDCGVIERGRPADLVGFRVQRGVIDWHSIPFEPERSEVDFVMINGKKMF
jgi:cytosine/adenosine deaminase-related metal-dependent hydrolase